MDWDMETSRIIRNRQRPTCLIKESQNLLEGTEENNDNVSKNSQSPGRDLNFESPKYKAEMLTARLRRSV
jgi:hypothetical protein